MVKIENSRESERALRNDELDTVSGGFGFVERFTKPACHPRVQPAARSAWRASWEAGAASLRPGSI